jgi:hypothetical protein
MTLCMLRVVAVSSLTADSRGHEIEFLNDKQAAAQGTRPFDGSSNSPGV